MRYSAIHQLLPSTHAGDPALREALARQRALHGHGICSEIFVPDSTALDAIVRPYAERSLWARSGDALVVSDGHVTDWDGPLLVSVPDDLPPPRRLRIALVGSDARTGIQTYTDALATGLRAAGHDVRQIGVRRHDARDLLRRTWAIGGVDVAIVEHELGIFRTLPLFAAELVLRLRRIPIILSLHELEPDKFGVYVSAYEGLHYRQKGNALFELARIPYAALRIGWLALRYRVTLWMLGLLPERILVHSRKALDQITLVTPDLSRVDQVPHLVAPLAGMPDAARTATPEARRALRRELGLPEEGLLLVSPGFLFKRKRLMQVAAATPREATLVIAGTGVPWEADHPAQIRDFIRDHRLANVVVDESYERMPLHLAAADAVVLFYKDIFQSGIASHAIHACKPLILSDLPEFRMYEGAALYAADERELGARMREIADPALRARLAAGARAIRDLLTPEAMALRYLAGWRAP